MYELRWILYFPLHTNGKHMHTHVARPPRKKCGKCFGLTTMQQHNFSFCSIKVSSPFPEHPPHKFLQHDNSRKTMTTFGKFETCPRWVLNVPLNKKTALKNVFYQRNPIFFKIIPPNIHGQNPDSLLKKCFIPRKAEKGLNITCQLCVWRTRPSSPSDQTSGREGKGGHKPTTHARRCMHSSPIPTSLHRRQGGKIPPIWNCREEIQSLKALDRREPYMRRG